MLDQRLEIYSVFQNLDNSNRKWPLQNFKEIVAELPEKSRKIMRSFLNIFNVSLVRPILSAKHIFLDFAF